MLLPRTHDVVVQLFAESAKYRVAILSVRTGQLNNHSSTTNISDIGILEGPETRREWPADVKL